VSTFFTSFGVTVLNLVFYLIFFAVVLLVLRRFLFKPVLGAIEKRQEGINRALDEAQQAAASVQQSRENAEKTLTEASSQAQEILRRAEQAAADIQERARADARREVETILSRARDEIARERAAAVQEIRAQTVDLALLAASRVIEANLDVERNRRLVEETIRSAELVAPSDGARGGRHG
jgi:F-type H+-transporting ATPase subunit b